jgi:prepilin-type N-terminal cleavage/methylation domain-containing protein
MNLRTNKSGFTLLEIIIVIIIVGVLASLALPRFFDTIEFSKTTEALNTIGSIKRAADRCALANEAVTDVQGDYTNCLTWADISMTDPSAVTGLNPGSHFDYSLGGGGSSYQVVATRNPDTLPSGSATITVSWDALVANSMTRVGTGAYSGVK